MIPGEGWVGGGAGEGDCCDVIVNSRSSYHLVSQLYVLDGGGRSSVTPAITCYYESIGGDTKIIAGALKHHTLLNGSIQHYDNQVKHHFTIFHLYFKNSSFN